MTKRRNFFLIAIALVAVAAFAANGSLVRTLFGPRAMLNLSVQQAQHANATTSGTEASTGGKTLPAAGPAAPAAKAATSVSVEPDTRGDRGYLIEARVATKEGKPVANAVVRIYDVVELLGTREMLIGSETTDGQGAVSISYKPSQGGSHQIVARPANAQLLASDGRATFDAAVVPSSYARERLPLDRFSVNLPLAGETVLLVVWGLFAFVLVGSLLRIPRSARHETPLSRRAREV